MSLLTITCPNCGLAKNVPKEKILKQVVRVKCSACSHRFDFKRPSLSLDDDHPSGKSRQKEPLPPLAEPAPEENAMSGRASSTIPLRTVAAMLLIMMSLVGARLWLEQQVRKAPYPYWLSASEQGVAVLYGDEFFVVDHDGSIRWSQVLPRDSDPCQILWHGQSIWVTDFKNTCIHRFSQSGLQTLPLEGPTIKAHLNVAVDPSSGDLFVTDSQSSRVLVYDSQGGFVREFGQRGRTKGKFYFPKDVAFDETGRLMVGNTRRPAVDAFRTDGDFVDQVVKPNSSPHFQFLSDFALGPQSIVTIECNELVTDCLVGAYDFEGRLLNKMAHVPGEQAPGDVAVWGEYVYVSDCRNRRVTYFALDTLEPIGPLSPELDAMGQDWNDEVSYYRMLSKGCLIIVMLCFIPMLWFYVRSKKNTP